MNIPYYDRALRAAHLVVYGRDSIPIAQELLQGDCWAYCLDSPEALPAGSMRGTTNVFSGVTTGYFPMVWRMA